MGSFFPKSTWNLVCLLQNFDESKAAAHGYFQVWKGKNKKGQNESNTA